MHLGDASKPRCQIQPHLHARTKSPPAVTDFSHATFVRLDSRLSPTDVGGHTESRAPIAVWRLTLTETAAAEDEEGWRHRGGMGG